MRVKLLVGRYSEGKSKCRLARRSVAVPFRELHVTTVNKQCATAPLHSLLATYEQVDRETSLYVITDVLAVRTVLSSSVLTLPLELISIDEVILLLEL